MNLEQQREALAEIGERLDELIIRMDPDDYEVTGSVRHAARNIAEAHSEVHRRILRDRLENSGDLMLEQDNV